MWKIKVKAPMSRAVQTLATHMGPVKDRLAAAGIILIDLKQEDYVAMPGLFGKDYRAFYEKLLAKGSIPHTVGQMTPDEAAGLAYDFWCLWIAISTDDVDDHGN